MDILIAGGTVVAGTQFGRAELALEGGRIAAILSPGDSLPQARETIDAGGLLIMPGALDAHTHFTGSNDQPAAELREGTCGAASAGVTTILEMPHSVPPATTLPAFLHKRAMAETEASVDFGLWAGLDGTNLSALPVLDAAGAIAFKGFLCSGDPAGHAADPSGLPRLDDDQLLQAMAAIHAFDGLIGLHCENHDMLIGARARAQSLGQDGSAHAAAGPELAEVEAVARVLLYAAEIGVRCHIVHLSSARSAALIAERRDPARISVETCPQYLLLDEDDLQRIGPVARCGPPLRPRAIVDALWAHVLAGRIDTLASDHCPYPTARKQVASIWEAGMGLTGIETAVPLFFSAAVQERGLAVVDFARMTATAPARCFGLADRKGMITVGGDADLAFYDPTAHWTVRGERFRGLGRWSAFEGMECRGQVVRTMVRGVTVYRDGDMQVAPGHGRFQTRMRDGA